VLNLVVHKVTTGLFINMVANKTETNELDVKCMVFSSLENLVEIFFVMLNVW